MILFPEISLRALGAARCFDALWVWTIGRSLDVAGSGRLDRTPLTARCGALGMSRAALYRALASAIFFRQAGSRLYLRGVVPVALDLGLTRISAWRVPNLLPDPPAKVWRSVARISIACLSDDKPLSAATIADLAGVSLRTVRRWTRGLLRQAHVYRVTRTSTLEEAAVIAQEGRRLGLGSRTAWRRARRAKRLRPIPYVVVQLPNSYDVDSAVSRASGNRRLRKALRRRLGLVSSTSSGRGSIGPSDARPLIMLHPRPMRATACGGVVSVWRGQLPEA